MYVCVCWCKYMDSCMLYVCDYQLSTTAFLTSVRDNEYCQCERWLTNTSTLMMCNQVGYGWQNDVTSTDRPALCVYIHVPLQKVRVSITTALQLRLLYIRSLFSLIHINSVDHLCHTMHVGIDISNHTDGQDRSSEAYKVTVCDWELMFKTIGHSIVLESVLQRLLRRYNLLLCGRVMVQKRHSAIGIPAQHEGAMVLRYVRMDIQWCVVVIYDQ